MAIKQTGPHEHWTASQAKPFSGQQRASLRFKFHYLADPSLATGSYVLARQAFRSFAIVAAGAGASPGTIKLRFYVVNAAGESFTRDVEVGVGATQEIVLVHNGDSGVQTAYLNGVGSQISTFAGATQDLAGCLILGGAYSTIPDLSEWIIDDVCFWDGHALTIGEILAMRDGADPATIGATAAARYRYTGDAPDGKAIGDAIALGDAGLRDAYGSGFDLAVISGSGTALYAEPLTWEPAARVKDSYVATSGRQVMIYFANKTTGGATVPSTIVTPPTLAINGSPQGSLINGLANSGLKFATFSLPPGVAVGPGDVATLDAPSGWLLTKLGAAEALASHQLRVMTGRSCFGTHRRRMAMPVGIVFEWFPTAHNSLCWLPKNLANAMGYGTGVATRDARGKPLTLVGTTAEFPVYSQSAGSKPNGIDSTGYPGPVGLFAIRWDDPTPASPTTWVLASGDPNTTTVTERMDLRNDGSGGVGQARVYDVQRKVGSTVAAIDVKAIVSNGAKAPRFERLGIFPPGEFVYADGAPVVIDMPDPHAVADRIKDRFRNPASIRAWQYLVGSINSFLTEPEHARGLEDWTWGFRQSTQSVSFGYTSVEPFDPAATPWMYSQVMGDKYPATLAASIDPGATSLVISDAATAPVLVGQRLFLDSEVVRVDSVSGTTVSVTRGMAGTSPSSHSPGVIQVGYRMATPSLGQGVLSSAVFATFRTQGPHRLLSGVTVGFSGTGWPDLVCTDGRTTRPSNYAGSIMATGADSFAVRLGPFQAPAVTLAGTTLLDPEAQTTTVRIGDTPQMPFAFWGKVANALDSLHCYIAIPHLATDDFIDRVGRELRDAIDPHRLVYMEVSNETWNTGAGYVNQHQFFGYVSASRHPGQNRLVSYVERTRYAHERLVGIFNEDGRNRGGQVKCFLNVQLANAANGSALLDWAAAQTPRIKIDALAAAPYINTTTTSQFDAETADAFANLDPDQAIDLWIHNLWHRADAIGIPNQVRDWKARIAAYNKAARHECRFVSYEGGLELVFKNSVANYVEKLRDFFYHPNMYIAELDFLAMLQEAGYELFHVFASASDWNGPSGYAWGYYHGVQQDHGRGDGSDGKADNRLCLARPGQAHTKAATVNQDLQNVSVRGQAWLDWNREAAGLARRASSRGRAPLPPHRRRATSGG